jgi:hypothetical protein
MSGIEIKIVGRFGVLRSLRGLRFAGFWEFGIVGK